MDKAVGDDRGGVVLVGPKEDVKALRPEPGTATGDVMGGVVGVTGEEPTGLVVVGILTEKCVRTIGKHGR